MLRTLHKTLIIRFSSVGDIVLSSPLIRVLRRHFPDCQIDYLVKAEFADLVRHNPWINRVLELPVNGTFHDLRRLRHTLAEQRYDLLIDIHDSLRSRLLCLGLGPTVRVNKRKLARFLLVKLKWDCYGSLGGSPAVAERYLETMQEFGLQDDGGGLDLTVPEDILRRARDLLGDAGRTRFIGICPAAKHGNKMWLKERFAETAAALASQNGDGVVVFGSGQETAQCQEITDMIRRACPSVPVFNLAGRASLLEAAAAMDRCSVVIANDTGLMHIAAARRRPVVVVYGPTVRQFGFFPYGTRSVVIEHPSLECRPCTHIGLPSCPKAHFRCMNEIPASRVIDAASRLLEH